MTGRSGLAIATLGAIIFAAIVIAIAPRPDAAPRDSTVASSTLGTPPSRPAPSISVPTSLSPQELADGRAIGRSNAPATLTVWEDFQCPVCGEFTREIQPRLYADFVVPGQLRIVYRDFAFIGQESFDAAAAARCAGAQGRFWPFHDYLFWNQGLENSGAFSRDRLGAIADAIGVDNRAFDSCMADGHALTDVQAETAVAEKTGIEKTPTLVVDNQVMPGAPLSDLQFRALENVIKASISAHQTPSP